MERNSTAKLGKKTKQKKSIKSKPSPPRPRESPSHSAAIDRQLLINRTVSNVGRLFDPAVTNVATRKRTTKKKPKKTKEQNTHTAHCLRGSFLHFLFFLFLLLLSFLAVFTIAAVLLEHKVVDLSATSFKEKNSR